MNETEVVSPATIRRVTEQHFYSFIKCAWHTIEPGDFVDGRHIRHLADHFQSIAEQMSGEAKVVRREIIAVPPRHMKSRLVSVFWPAWCWTRWPRLRFLFASHTFGLSLDHSRLCRAVIESEWYQSLWGGGFKLISDQNVKHYYANNRGGFRFSTSVEGGVTGHGADILIGDDLLDVKDAQSPAMRKAAWEWFSQTWSTRVNDPRHHCMIVLGHRVHEADIAGQILSNPDHGFQTLCFPAEYESMHPHKAATDWRATEGEMLWPERFDPSTLAEIKRSIGSYAYAGQYQQRPSPAGGGLLRREWFRTWRDLPKGTPRIKPEDLPEHFGSTFASVDCSMRGGAGSDYAVAQVWGKQGPHFYLLDQVRGQWGFNETLEALKRFFEKWKTLGAIYVEEAANGFAIIDQIKRQFPAVLGVKPARLGGKVERVNACTPFLEAGNVFLPPPPAAWVADLIEECAAFPNGAHDDQVDTMTLALLVGSKRVSGPVTASARGLY